METSCGIEEHNVVAVALGMLNGGLGNIDGVCLPHLKDGYIELCADGLQLLDSGGTVNTARGEQRALALPADVPRELRAVRGLARALKADEHNDCGRLGTEVQLLVLAAHEPAQLFVDYFYHHLRRRQSLQHFRAARAFGDGFGEILYDLVAYVGLKQRHAHFAHRFLDVGLSESALAAQLFEGRIQFFR